MKIFFDKRSIRAFRQSIEDALEEGDVSSLRDDLVDMFSDEQVEEIERRLDTDDFLDFLDQIIEEWSEEESLDLLEILSERLVEIGIELGLESDDEGETEEEESVDEDVGEERFEEEEEEEEEF